MNEKLKHLKKLVEKYLENHDELFFPEGYYGRDCYLLNHDDFYGPHRIPDYVVPIEFSEKAESMFLEKIDEACLDLDESKTEALEEFCEGIDLSHGDQGWDLEPFEFIDMLKNGCQADTLYLPSEWEYGDFLESCEANLNEMPLVPWNSLQDEVEIDCWISDLNNVLTQYHWSQDKYIKAYKFAAEAHNGQIVPGTDLPYIMHLSFVAMEVIAALAVEQMDHPDLAVQCALLHDTIEDTGVVYDEVQAKFGNDVADGVLALSQDKQIAASEDKFKRKWLQLEDSLKRIKRQPKEIWMVKLADRITNLQPPPNHWNDEKIARYKQGAELIHKELAQASDFLGWRLWIKINEYPGADH